jgi:hypothetical protein
MSNVMQSLFNVGLALVQYPTVRPIRVIEEYECIILKVRRSYEKHC